MPYIPSEELEEQLTYIQNALSDIESNMFDIESKNQDEIIITTKSTSIKFNIMNASIDASLHGGVFL